MINTHGMLCSNQQMLAQIWPFTRATPPVLVDWLPWNHTFGGNHNFNLVLKRGGTLYVDGGKPAPGLVEQTVANLAEISPTIYFNVPAGFAMLLPFLERDAKAAGQLLSPAASSSSTPAPPFRRTSGSVWKRSPCRPPAGRFR